MRIRDARLSTSVCFGMLALVGTLSAPARACAQATENQLKVLRLEATPKGALPPIPLPMPASRDNNYWGIRLQAGHRRGQGGPDLNALAGGIDFQWQGGSVIGLTGGYQERDCELAGVDCGSHALFGARGRFGIMTGGSRIGELVGDAGATTTWGAEIGLGYAPNVVPDMNACTVDLGMPITVSVGKRVRFVTFLTPGFVWDINCSNAATPGSRSFLTGLGIGVQQLGSRSLDVHLGLQKIHRSGTGYQLGISVTYVRLP